MSSKFSYLDGGNGRKKRLKERLFYILQNIILKISKVNSGSYHMTCLPRMESSEASVMKETCLFHRRVGSILTLQILIVVKGSSKLIY